MTNEQVQTAPRIYTPGSPIRRPRELLLGMARGVRDSRSLAWRLAVRDISAQYRQTSLGYLWSVAPPLANTLVWAILNGSQIVQINTGKLPYVVFALTGTIYWQLFFDALNAPLRQLGLNRSMLNRVNFPPEALLLSGLLQVLFSFAIKLVLLGVILAVYQVPLASTAALFFVPALALIAAGSAIGMFLAPIGLLYKDVDQILAVIVGPLMLFTPVVYTQATIGFLAHLMNINPLTPLFTTLRALLYGGNIPGAAFLAVSTVAILLSLMCWMIYRLAMPILIERIEA